MSFRTEFLLSYILEARSTYRYPLRKHLLKHSWSREVGIRVLQWPYADSPPTPGRRTVPGPGCSKALPYPATQINGLRGTGSIHQRSSPNSSCKHKNDDIFLMTTKQLKLQECISSPFSGQHRQHVCAFNVPNTAAQNTLNSFHLTQGLLKVLEETHTSLLLVLLHKIKTRELKPQRPWDLIVQLYSVIALFVTWSPPGITALVFFIGSHQPFTCSSTSQRYQKSKQQTVVQCRAFVCLQFQHYCCASLIPRFMGMPKS